jgi:RHS repeat-associated protein
MMLGNGTTRKYGYDARSQLTTQIEMGGATPLVTIVDGYDAVGNRITRSLDGNLTTWSYDDLYRLTGQLKAGQVCTYTMDGVGNLKTMWEGGNFPKTFSFDVADRLVMMVEGANLTTYSWSGFGALESEFRGANLTTYSYSGQDQLIAVQEAGGARSTYTFDGDGLRRTAQERNALPTTMVWDGSDYLLLKGPSSEQVVLTIDGEILSVGNYDLLPDPLGSVIGYTQAGSATQVPYAYWPYGRRIGPAIPPPFPFQYVGSLGYYTDSVDRDYVRARELYKSIGRWMQTDPLWPEQPAYFYASGRPIGVTDPSGTIPLACGLICAPGIACAIDVWLVCRNWQKEGFESFLDCAWKVYDELPTWTKWLCWGSLAGCFACLGRELLKRIGPRCPHPVRPWKEPHSRLRSILIASLKEG